MLSTLIKPLISSSIFFQNLTGHPLIHKFKVTTDSTLHVYYIKVRYSRMKSLILSSLYTRIASVVSNIVIKKT